MKGDLSRVNRLITEAEAKITENMSQIENLNHIISEADDEQARQKKEMEVIKGERDILSTQASLKRTSSWTLAVDYFAQVHYKCHSLYIAGLDY